MTISTKLTDQFSQANEKTHQFTAGGKASTSKDAALPLEGTVSYQYTHKDTNTRTRGSEDTSTSEVTIPIQAPVGSVVSARQYVPYVTWQQPGRQEVIIPHFSGLKADGSVNAGTEIRQLYPVFVDRQHVDSNNENGYSAGNSNADRDKIMSNRGLSRSWEIPPQVASQVQEELKKNPPPRGQSIVSFSTDPDYRGQGWYVPVTFGPKRLVTVPNAPVAYYASPTPMYTSITPPAINSESRSNRSADDRGASQQNSRYTPSKSENSTGGTQGDSTWSEADEERYQNS